MLAAALVKRPGQAELALVALIAAALVIVGVRKRRLLARLGATRLLGWVALLMPLAALIGPALAPPGLRQLFAFRLLLALAAVLVAAVLVGRAGDRALADAALSGAVRPLVRLAGRRRMIWAADRPAGFRYLLVLATMLALTAATAFAGTTGRRLQFLVATLGIGYGLTIARRPARGVRRLRLSTSSLVNATGSRSLSVTAFYFNQNDLATYLTIAWAFLLTVFLFTRRRSWRVLTLAALGLGLFAFYPHRFALQPSGHRPRDGRPGAAAAAPQLAARGDDHRGGRGRRRGRARRPRLQQQRATRCCASST